MSLEKELIRWYDLHRRHMPWREDPTPYHVYLSEIMLQQTQVDTVRAYYLRFLKAFPTIQDLANASEEEVLKLWEGLGYYSRGRNLHKAAQKIVSDYGGVIPSKKEELLSLPGIGAYTSRAILSIGFHQKEIAVDGNLIRVFSRLSETNEENFEKMKALCEAFYKKELNEENPSKFNQALMDLGEMVCLPHGEALCESCPFASFCHAHKDNVVSSYPPEKKAKEKRVEEKTILLFAYQDKIALHKREETGLLASLYEFPSLAGKASPEEVLSYLSSIGIQGATLENLGEANHVFSHLIWQMRGYRVKLSQPYENKEWVWADRKELRKTYPIPSAFSYYKKQI
jgi:A/G-specific adenine glycosylase